MTAITKHFRQFRRSIHRFFTRLGRRRTTVEAKITVAVPPFFKLELNLKSEPPEAANGNRPRQTKARA